MNKKILYILLIFIFFGCSKSKKPDINLDNIPNNDYLIKDKLITIYRGKYNEEFFKKLEFDYGIDVKNKTNEDIRTIVFKLSNIDLGPLMLMKTDKYLSEVLVNAPVYSYKKFENYIYYNIPKILDLDEGYYKKNYNTDKFEKIEKQKLNEKPEENFEYFKIEGKDIFGLYKINLETKKIEILNNKNIEDFDFYYSEILGLNEDYIYSKFEEKFYIYNQKINEIKKINLDKNSKFYLDEINNLLYLLEENTIKEINLLTNTTNIFEADKKIVDLETYGIIKIKNNTVYFYNRFGKIATFNIKTNETNFITHIEEYSKYPIVTKYFDDTNAYFFELFIFT